jgi:disulfide bond formation protein DsbB
MPIPTLLLDNPAMNPSATQCYSCSATFWTYLATATSLAALAGSLYLSLGMGLKACPLCFYQRVFVMATVGVLVLGLLVPGGRPGLTSLLALPGAVGGLAVAGWHNYLEFSGILECPHGVGGVGTAPQQSLGVFAVLTFALLMDVAWNRLLIPALAALVLGCGFAFGVIVSTPKSVVPDYELPLDQDMCRKIKL